MKLRVAPRHSGLRLGRLARIWALFRHYVAREASTLTVTLAFALGAVAMQLLRPWPIKILFDAVLIPQAGAEDPWLASLQELPTDAVVAGTCAGLLAVSVLWGLFSYGQAYLTARTGQSIVYDLRARAYSHLQRLSLSFHHRKERGDLLMRLTGDINSLRDLLVDSALLAVSSGILLIAMLSILLAMDWRLSLVVIALLPLLALTTFRFSFEIRDASRKQRKREGRIAAMVGEMLNGIHVIQAFGNERHQDRLFRRSNRQGLKAGLRTTRLEASMARLIEILLACGTAAVLWYGVNRVRAGVISPGDLLVFTAYVQGSFRPLRRLARVAARVSKAAASAERVMEFLKEEPSVCDAPGAKRARNVRGGISFRRVRFGYPDGPEVLQDLDLEVEPGSFIGIVGPSGAGKSTLLALLLRLYDPDRGKVLVDGRDVRRYQIESLREQFGVVLQDAFLFGGTVRDNIAFGLPEASDAQVKDAARLANAHGFIELLSDGYDTSVAESGVSLSGGQRQRIAIARAFLRDAPILLLDEPTVGLDAAAERDVLDDLERLVRDRTGILVAHRLATVRNADRIFLLRDGTIDRSGTHEELLAADSWYASAYALQQGAEAPALAANPRAVGGPHA